MAKTENGFILALDQGTTSSRSIIFDNQLTPIAIAQKPLNIITPKSGFIEQNANDIWQTQISTAQEVIAKAGLLATDISAIGITNQRE
ncbi:glycerol kinase, partial [Salmonella enterica subsp. enterica serovar Enteritidis]|nr:glycerol kinase [Salmonella enterica subsp. enterica serovar Enteritidis]